MATWRARQGDRTALMLPWMLRSPRITSPACTDDLLDAEIDGDDQGDPALAGDVVAQQVDGLDVEIGRVHLLAMPIFTFWPCR